MKAAANLVCDMHMSIVYFYDNPVTKYALKPISDMGYVNITRIDKVMDDLLKPGLDPSEHVKKVFSADWGAAEGGQG